MACWIKLFHFPPLQLLHSQLLNSSTLNSSTLKNPLIFISFVTPSGSSGLMKLRTTFDIPSFPSKISYKSKIFTMGSCFSGMLAEKLQQRKFNILDNPFGTIFNPVSMFQLLSQSLLDQQADGDLVLDQQQRSYHYGMHSSVSAENKTELLKKIVTLQALTKEFLAQSSHIVFSFGSAFVYELKTNGKFVSNCHKQPQSLFDKRLLRLEEMLDHFKRFYEVLRRVNPSAVIVMTVSPVRHSKDGIPKNQLSKSLLRVLTHQLGQDYEGLVYFPSYELMMDDLRDYRFYSEDMLHPSPVAENYIWEQFQNCYLDKDSMESAKQIAEINLALQHRPFHPGSLAHIQFLQDLVQRMERLTPEFDFSKEIADVKEKLGMYF